MRQLESLFVVLILGSLSSGCDNFALFVSTGPLPRSNPSPTAPLPPRPLILGDLVNGTFVVPEVCFDLKAPRSGVLFVWLSWDRRHGDIDLAFVSTVLPATADIGTSDGSIVGTLKVAQGQSYRIAVVGQDGPVPFTLRTSIQ